MAKVDKTELPWMKKKGKKDDKTTPKKGTKGKKK